MNTRLRLLTLLIVILFMGVQTLNSMQYWGAQRSVALTDSSSGVVSRNPPPVEIFIAEEGYFVIDILTAVGTFTAKITKVSSGEVMYQETMTLYTAKEIAVYIADYPPGQYKFEFIFPGEDSFYGLFDM